jgi:uncharacterized membrane protein YeaQ/YmgE (transglycosylase-associated protein family)
VANLTCYRLWIDGRPIVNVRGEGDGYQASGQAPDGDALDATWTTARETFKARNLLNAVTKDPDIGEHTMLELIWIVIIGLVVGVVARFLMPGPDPAGFLVTALLGMGGAVVATYLGRAVGLYGAGEGAGFIASVIGAILVLFVYRRVRTR